MNPHLYEVHTHLYGCLEDEDLVWLGRRKKPRWHIFEQSYQKLYGRKPPLEILDENRIWVSENLTSHQREILRSFYMMKDTVPEGFLHFQNRFDFIISLSHTDPEELQEIALRVAGRQEEIYAEYRMMFSPRTQEKEFEEKVISLVEAFQKAEEMYYPKQTKIIISLNREEGVFEKQYEIIKNIIAKQKVPVLLGIDFAGYEENDPPGKKEKFLRKAVQEKKMVVLYHVGESFTERTPSSAIRWIYQVAQTGVHRLAHCLALSYDEEKVRNRVFRENARERKEHLAFLLEIAEKESAGAIIDTIYRKLQEDSIREEITVFYDSDEVRLHLWFLEYVLEELRKNKTVIETCPTSNMRIAGFSPVKYFAENNLTLCIGADDPKIFDTSLQKEFLLAEKLTGDKAKVKEIQENNQKYCSWNIYRSLQQK